MNEVKILVVDDSDIIRELLKRTLTQLKGCLIVGMATDGEEGLAMVSALQPEVVILDISMPHKNGIQVLREIRSKDPDMVIIMFTSDPSIALEKVCLETGANFYLDKLQLMDLIAICEELVREKETSPDRDCPAQTPAAEC